MLARLLPKGHGPSEPLFHGERMASAKVRDLQVRCDLDLDELAVVRWEGLARKALYVTTVGNPDAPARIQELFERLYPQPFDV